MQGSRAWAATYMVLALLGALLPLTAFLPWLGAHGVDVPRFLADLFVNPVSSFFGLDVIISALALTLLIVVQGRRDGVRPLWLPIAATFLIGVSCGLPLFLALREIALIRR
jgi:quinol-cytochrome oxidoreductase complex cytochrome b subunit